MNFPTYAYENTPRKVYEGGATFVPVCCKCGRYVKPDETLMVNEWVGLLDAPNCTCKRCGRSHMLFEGFVS